MKSNDTAKQSRPAWAAPLDDFFWIQHILRLYPTLNIWAIRCDGNKLTRWWQMTPVGLKPEPYHFRPPTEPGRTRYAQQLRSVKKVLRSGKGSIVSFEGFHDLVLPLPGPPGKHAVFFAGQFSRKHLGEAELRILWKDLSGQEAGAANAAYHAFARSALSAPVFSPDIMGGIKYILKGYASMIAGRRCERGFQKKAQALYKRILARHLPHPSWAAQALSPDKLKIVPWTARKKLEDYEKEELGISRVPTTAMALLPLESRQGGRDPVAQMVRNGEIQRSCFRLAKALPETLAENLGDYGVLFLTSTGPEKPAILARQELWERAETIRQFLRREHGADVVLAIGSRQAPGETLHPSYQEAVSTLHHCLAAGKAVMFYDEIPELQKTLPYTELQETAARLARAMESLSQDSLKVALEAYVQRVLNFAATRTEFARACFLSMLLWLLELSRKRGRIHAADSEAFLAGFRAASEELGTVYELAALFKDKVQTLMQRNQPGTEPQKNARLEETLEYLKQNFQSPLKLKEVASHAGLSVTVFCGAFKKFTGQSFVTYLQGLRIEHAKHLLRSTPLDLEEVSHLSGFTTMRHFTRTFRQKVLQTPFQYRQSQ